MTVKTVERDLRQRVQFAGDWRPRDAAERRFFDPCCQVLEAARGLERAAGRPQSAEATDAALGSLGAAFESLANATLMMREAAAAEVDGAAQSRHELEQREQLGRLLFTADQNLRFAAHACALSRESLASLSEQPH